MVGTPPTISINNTSFNVGDTLSVTITFGTSHIGTLYIGNNSISIPQQKTSSYTYDYVLTTSGNYSVYFRDDNILDSNTINISVTASSSSSSVFLTTITKVKTALENVFVKKTDITDNLTSTDTDKPLSANQGKLLDSNKEDKSNKVSSWTSTTTDTNYPSEKLVKNSIDNLGNGLSDAISGVYSNVYSTLNNYQTKNLGGAKAYQNKNLVTDNSGNITVEAKPTIPSASSTTPSADTTSGSVGTGITWARADHTHPKSTLYAEATHTHNNYLTSHQDISGKANSSDFDTLTATVNYTDNTSETVTFYVVPNNNNG